MSDDYVKVIINIISLYHIIILFSARRNYRRSFIQVRSLSKEKILRRKKQNYNERKGLKYMYCTFNVYYRYIWFNNTLFDNFQQTRGNVYCILNVH